MYEYKNCWSLLSNFVSPSFVVATLPLSPHGRDQSKQVYVNNIR